MGIDLFVSRLQMAAHAEGPTLIRIWATQQVAVHHPRMFRQIARELRVMAGDAANLLVDHGPAIRSGELLIGFKNPSRGMRFGGCKFAVMAFQADAIGLGRGDRRGLSAAHIVTRGAA